MSNTLKRVTPLSAKAKQDLDQHPSPSEDIESNAPPAKRVKENPPAPGTSKGGGASGAPGHQEIDPNELGDVLNAAGVDLREEESLLNSGLSEQGGLAGARLLHAPKERDYQNMLLNYDQLKRVMSRIAGESGLKLASDDMSSQGGLNQDPLSLICASCEEWLSVILEEAAAYSRHRRLALNPTSMNEQGEISKALREIVHQDKVKDSKHEAVKERLGLTEDQAAVDEKESEERTQRAANDTARMMTANIGRKKKFSWMSDSSAGAGASASSRSGAARRQNNDPNKFKEIREDNGIVMRDIIPALERKHMGVKRALIKGYSRLRN